MDLTQQNSLVYLNGEFLPLSEARISVLDRGFLFGDGVYEVIPVYGGQFFRLDEHLHRLDNSLAGIHMAPPLTHEQWRETLLPLLSEARDQSIYLQVTRGNAGKRDHAIPAGCPPTVFAMATPFPPAATNPEVTAVTLDDLRWQLCNIKATALLANILLKHEALEQGYSEAIMIRDGMVTEGAASNVFAVIDNTLVTPPKSRHLLPGITRDLILELAASQGIPNREANITREQLGSADEIWLTSSTREIMPVINLDGKQVGNGKPGPMWHRMHACYQDYKQQFYLAP